MNDKPSRTATAVAALGLDGLARSPFAQTREPGTLHPVNENGQYVADKQGRNAPCWCNSGRKTKRCCGGA